ncbi:MAG: anti-sigma factor antagonist [Desulfovibrionales bacterium]|nr:anti-sigma factor antagonist [Desulfovibrionales bacterium]
MELKERRQDQAVVLELSGRLDSNTADGFEEKLLGMIRNGEKYIVLDFSSLEYISSAGLRVLLKAARELKQTDGKMHLCSLKDYIQEVFDLSGFVSFLPIYAVVEDCIDAF